MLTAAAPRLSVPEYKIPLQMQNASGRFRRVRLSWGVYPDEGGLEFKNCILGLRRIGSEMVSSAHQKTVWAVCNTASD